MMSLMYDDAAMLTYKDEVRSAETQGPPAVLVRLRQVCGMMLAVVIVRHSADQLRQCR